MNLQPGAGARFLFERDGDPDPQGAVRYRGAIVTPAARYDYAVTFGGDGAARIERAGGDEGEPAERALKLLRTLARTLGRHAVAESPAEWPRRVLRWRKID